MQINKGFTLIEMVVAVAVFTLLVSASSGLFVNALRAQRYSLTTQEILDQTSYVMEYMSRALRMARKDISGECITAKSNYQFEDNCIKFRNYHDECQQFCLDGSRLKEIKGESSNYLTSESLTVEGFWVELSGQQQDDYLQPRATILLTISGKEQSNIKIQTTVSQRNLDIQK